MDVELYKTRGNRRGSGYSIGGRGGSVYMADPTVAHLPGVRAEVGMVARDAAAIASVNLQRHSRWGHGNSYITLEKAGGPDWLVVLVDPKGEEDGGGNAAMFIEGQTHVLADAFGSYRVKAPDWVVDKSGRYKRKHAPMKEGND